MAYFQLCGNSTRSQRTSTRSPRNSPITLLKCCAVPMNVASQDGPSARRCSRRRDDRSKRRQDSSNGSIERVDHQTKPRPVAPHEVKDDPMLVDGVFVGNLDW